MLRADAPPRLTPHSMKGVAALKRRGITRTAITQINDTAEVQRVTKSLGVLSAQIPKIGVDLENIAAALAEAQRSASGQIATLESQLQQLDDLIGHALDQEKDPTPTPDERSALDSLITSMEEQAIKDTEAALDQLRSIRDRYSDCLNKSLSNLRTEGYDPAAIHGLDSDVPPEPSALQAGRLGDLRHVTNQAVVDQMAKVRAAQEAINKAMATIYTKGSGSPEGGRSAELAQAQGRPGPRARRSGQDTRLQQHRSGVG
jgi:hypothetical protein